MIIYISGPMTGYEDNNFPAFAAAAAELRNKGFRVISPHEVEQPDKSWQACMRKDIKALMDADTIALLPAWQKSSGAGIEISIASALGMQIVDAASLEPIALNVAVDIKEKIQAGDTVYHKPCDEKWYVLGVNHTTGRLCVAGWPHTIADIADCTLVEKGTGIGQHEIDARQSMFGGGWE